MSAVLPEKEEVSRQLDPVVETITNEEVGDSKKTPGDALGMLRSLLVDDQSRMLDTEQTQGLRFLRDFYKTKPYPDRKGVIEGGGSSPSTKCMKPTRWREAVMSIPGPDEDNPTDWNLKDTGVVIGSDFVDVPELACHRARKLDQLLKQLASSGGRRTFISSSAKSGKTTMAHLLQGYVVYLKRKFPEKLENLSVHFFTFSGFTPKSGETREEVLDRFFSERCGMNLDAFETNIASNPNCIVILDDVHIINDTDVDLWKSFQPNENDTGCSLVAFSAYDTFISYRKRDPFCRRLSYEFVAFSEAEFDCLFDLVFKKRMSDSQKKEMSETLKKTLTN